SIVFAIPAKPVFDASQLIAMHHGTTIWTMFRGAFFTKKHKRFFAILGKKSTTKSRGGADLISNIQNKDNFLFDKSGIPMP
ncbi:MAG: hypothetical protein KDD28_18575, partial [Phaeodactylibacter sp.]|nr:hypothetical protein [Phaeodactylibacter sp.]